MLFKVSAFTSYGCNLLLFLFGSLGIFSSTYYCTLHLEPLGERDHQWMEIPVKKTFLDTNPELYGLCSLCSKCLSLWINLNQE